MRLSLSFLVLWLMTIPASAMSLIYLATPSDTITAGGFVTTVAPLISLTTGMPGDILTLFLNDYPGFTYANAATAADGTLTINSLTPFQTGLGGGLSITARFAPSVKNQVPPIYEWLQYLTIDPLSAPFLGATSSPFTDPPPDARDDNLPFYWTDLQRTTPGLGYSAGGNVNDDLLFADAPSAMDARAPVSVRLSLYVASFDSTNRSVTIYDGVQYGFDLATPTSTPEPPTGGWLAAGICIMALRKFRNRCFLPD